MTPQVYYSVQRRPKRKVIQIMRAVLDNISWWNISRPGSEGLNYPALGPREEEYGTEGLNCSLSRRTVKPTNCNG